MALNIYADAAARRYYAEPTSAETKRMVAAGDWVLVGPAPDPGNPPGEEPFDDAVRDRIVDPNSLTAKALRAASVSAVDAAIKDSSTALYADLFALFTTWSGGTTPTPTTYLLLTESGDTLTTEAGDVLVTA